MYFGTFEKTVDVSPNEADEGDMVLQYESEDGWSVAVMKLHDGHYETDAWNGNPVKQDEYVLVIRDPSGKELPPGQILDRDARAKTKSRMRTHAVEAVTTLVETGSGAH